MPLTRLGLRLPQALQHALAVDEQRRRSERERRGECGHGGGESDGGQEAIPAPEHSGNESGRLPGITQRPAQNANDDAYDRVYDELEFHTHGRAPSGLSGGCMMQAILPEFVDYPQHLHALAGCLGLSGSRE